MIIQGITNTFVQKIEQQISKHKNFAFVKIIGSHKRHLTIVILKGSLKRHLSLKYIFFCHLPYIA